MPQQSQALARSATRLFSRRTALRLHKALPAIVFLAPATLAFLIFRYYPLARGLYMSLFLWDMADPPGQFVGLDNFVHAITSPHFHTLLGNTLILFVFGILLGFWVPIAQSLILHQLHKKYYLFRFLYVLPVAVPSIAFLMTWMYIWRVDGGLANGLMTALGLPATASPAQQVESARSSHQHPFSPRQHKMEPSPTARCPPRKRHVDAWKRELICGLIGRWTT